MKQWISADGLRWRELTPFGVELDCDLSKPFSKPEAAQRFVSLFNQHGLIVASGQTLSMDQQIELLSHIGPVLPGVDGSGYISSDDAYTGARAELAFHSDYAFTPFPLEAISLHAIDVVDNASSTRFAGAERAYKMLSAKQLDLLSTSDSEMISPDLDAMSSRSCDTPNPGAMVRYQRPSIVPNPRTRRPCIGVSEMHTARLLGMNWDASRDTLNDVYERLYAPENIHEHIWRRGDIVLWDNVSVHHARGDIEAVGRRVLQRVTLGKKSLFEMHPEFMASPQEEARA